MQSRIENFAEENHQHVHDGMMLGATAFLSFANLASFVFLRGRSSFGLFAVAWLLLYLIVNLAHLRVGFRLMAFTGVLVVAVGALIANVGLALL